MNHPEYIKNTIANLVTYIAMSFPVAYINTVAFFKHGKLVGTCNWHFDNEHISGIHRDFKDFSEVEITATDTDGKILTIFSPAVNFNKEYYV